MTFLSRILARVGRERIEQSQGTGATPAVDHRGSDGKAGTSRDDEFVGRVSGKDEGYLDTGAEHRSPEENDDPRSHG